MEVGALKLILCTMCLVARDFRFSVKLWGFIFLITSNSSFLFLPHPSSHWSLTLGSFFSLPSIIPNKEWDHFSFRPPKGTLTKTVIIKCLGGMKCCYTITKIVYYISFFITVPRLLHPCGIPLWPFFLLRDSCNKLLALCLSLFISLTFYCFPHGIPLKIQNSLLFIIFNKSALHPCCHFSFQTMPLGRLQFLYSTSVEVCYSALRID